MLPLASVWQRQGLTVKSWMQPSHWWPQVWLTHQKLRATGLNATSSGSIPFTANRPEPKPLNKNSQVNCFWSCQVVAYATSAAVIRLGVVSGVPGGQVESPGVHLPVWLHSALAL